MNGHEFWAYIAKSYGLIYMMVIFFAATLYALWPANKEKFDKAANSILQDDQDDRS